MSGTDFALKRFQDREGKAPAEPYAGLGNSAQREPRPLKIGTEMPLMQVRFENRTETDQGAFAPFSCTPGNHPTMVYALAAFVRASLKPRLRISRSMGE